jgi:hypothetical protein
LYFWISIIHYLIVSKDKRLSNSNSKKGRKNGTMADITKIAEVVAVLGKEALGNGDIKKFLCGTYTDGTPRNFVDAFNGEYLSADTKKKHDKKKKKYLKNKKKLKKNKYKL